VDIYDSGNESFLDRSILGALMNEQVAIDALLRGDLSGLAFLVRQYQLKAVRVAFLIIHDEGLAQEVVQNAFLRTAERIEQFDRKRPFEPWFMRIVVNDAIKAVKRGPSLVSIDAGEDTFQTQLQSQLPSPEEMVTMTERNEAVWQALTRLTPKQRAAVVMRYYLELSEAEMAKELEIAPGTVKWRLHTARERLRQMLEIVR
jgi:RNA polymerase sigma-70 factor (ECF subfamily)